VVKWRVFRKSKKEIPNSKELIITKNDDKPLTEYKETLYTDYPKSKKQAYAFSNQTSWRDVQAIEKNIDIIHITNAEKPTNELDKIVDRIIAKKKK
jgi:predicted HAD superfamily phosphohydrolase YqeG